MLTKKVRSSPLMPIKSSHALVEIVIESDVGESMANQNISLGKYNRHLVKPFVDRRSCVFAGE